MIGFKSNSLHRGAHRLNQLGATTVCTVADTNYLIDGEFISGKNKGFRSDSLSKLIHISSSSVNYSFIGISDLSVTKACRVTYTLYKDGSPLTDLDGNVASTIRDFTSASKVGPIAINVDIGTLNPGCELQVYVKCDAADVVVTHNTLMLNLMGDR